MGATPSNRIDTSQITKQHNLQDIVEGELGRPSRSGSKYKVWSCPFHEGDNTPSFTVWEDHYKCFGCEEKGNVISWTMKRAGLPFKEACQALDTTGKPQNRKNTEAPAVLEGRAHLLEPTSVPAGHAPDEAWQVKASGIMAECEVLLWDQANETSAKARAYLTARGLGQDILSRFLIGFNPEGNKKHGLWVPRGIIIPNYYQPSNTLYALNVRQSQGAESKYWKVAGSKTAPFGVENLQGKRVAFILEGEFDTLLVLQTLDLMGEQAAHMGAFTMGSASTQDVSAWLLTTPELLEPACYLVATDSDSAGRDAANEWLSKTKRARLYPPPEMPPFSSGKPRKDITDLWKLYGFTGVYRWIRAAAEAEAA